MAIEIANTFEAGGIFDGVAQPLNGAIISANGVQALDPATTPSVPLGGFTRVTAGFYVIKLDRAIDGAEGAVLVTPYNPAGQANLAVPSAAILPDGTINVLDSAHQVLPLPGFGVDFAFYLGVFRYAYGPNNTPS